MINPSLRLLKKAISPSGSVAKRLLDSVSLMKQDGRK